MPFTDKELHPSRSCGSLFHCFLPGNKSQKSLEKLPPPVNGSVPQGQKKLINCCHLKPSLDYWYMVCGRWHVFTGRAKLCWNFFSLLRDASDIHRFPTLHMVEIHFPLENLWISEPPLGILEKFQQSLALPNVKIIVQYYFYKEITEVSTVLFLQRNYWSIYRMHQGFSETLHNIRMPMLPTLF